MDNSDFAFLAHRHHRLYESIERAEQYVHSDPVSSLMRARQFIEFMVLGPLSSDSSKLSRAFPHEGRLQNAIEQLRRDNKITKAECESLTYVRQHGNDAVHNGYPDCDSAIRALKDCYFLAVRRLWQSESGRCPDPKAYRCPPRPAVITASARSISWRAWIIRPYPHYQDCREAFRKESIIAIGWHILGRLTGASSEELAQRLQAHFPENEGRWGRDVETILLFRDAISVNDLVVMAPYHRDESTVAVGQVSGPYEFRKSGSANRTVYAQQRRVRWLHTHVSRMDLPATVQRNIRKLTLVETSASDLLSFCQQRGYPLRP
jgi:hypothetical protein